MPAQWVDFRSIKGRSPWRPFFALRRSSSASQCERVRGKCPLCTLSTSSNDSFSVSFTRNACPVSPLRALRLARPRRRKRLRLRAEMERCSIRRLLCTCSIRSQKSDSSRHIRNEESVAHPPENRPLSFTLHNIDHQHPMWHRVDSASKRPVTSALATTTGTVSFVDECDSNPHEHGDRRLLGSRNRPDEPKYRLPAASEISPAFNLHRPQKGNRNPHSRRRLSTLQTP